MDKNVEGNWTRVQDKLVHDRTFKTNHQWVSPTPTGTREGPTKGRVLSSADDVSIRHVWKCVSVHSDR
jgi:hypothetical protein